MTTKTSIDSRIESAGSLLSQDEIKLRIFLEGEGFLVSEMDQSEEGLTVLETLIIHAVLCHRVISDKIGKTQRYGTELLR